MGGVIDRGCARAQGWASLELDGELSQLERALLERHLERCPRCDVAVAQMRAFTEALRAAPLERPETPVAVAPARRQRTRPLALRVAAAATLAAAAGGLGVFAGSLGNEPGAPAEPDADIAMAPPSPDELRDLRGVRPPVPRSQEPEEERPVPVSPGDFGGA